MKKFILLIMLGLLVTAGLLTGCGIIVTPSGPESTRDYNITDFSNINVGGPFEAQIIQADSYKVTITANENLFKYVDISKTGSTLNVKTRPLSLVGSHVLKEHDRLRLSTLAGRAAQHFSQQSVRVASTAGTAGNTDNFHLNKLPYKLGSKCS